MTANRFLDAVQSRLLHERDTKLADHAGVRGDMRRALPKPPRRKQVKFRDPVPEERLQSVARLKRLDMSFRDIAAALGLTMRQVEFAWQRVKRRAEDEKRKGTER